MGTVERSGEDADLESGEEEEAHSGKDLPADFFHRHKGDVLTQAQISMAAMAALPSSVRRRIHALKNLQLKVTHLEADFYKEVHDLEVKYIKQYYPYFDKRAEIVTGSHEPNDEECQWESDEELTEGVDKLQIDSNKVEPSAKKMDENVKGIPDFWLTIFKNVSLLSEMVQEHDEPILSYLQDIKVKLLEKEPMGFVLEFHFSTNPYFTNTVLTKEYHMKCTPDTDNPFEFEGPEIFTCTGCSINWRKDKNVTMKTIKKKQKHKSRGSVRTVTEVVQTDSFFNFFYPPKLPVVDPPEELRNLLSTDFEIGHFLRERVVPRAVLLYTGEGLDEEEDYEEEEEEDEGSEESSGEEEEEERGRKRTGRAAKRIVAGGPNAANAYPSECKQQ